MINYLSLVSRHKFVKTAFLMISGLSVFLGSFQLNLVFAQTQEVVEDGAGAFSQVEVVDSLSPPNTSSLSLPTGTSKIFIVSAYYSPIQGQNKYFTGSFSGDVRLNGEGVHSADGSKVYPGMIAAPKNYAFGTKMNIPGIGIVAVHDRGGAIVQAGQRNQAYDRLDVWMGYGDEGLKQALSWGRRTVEVTVYGINPDIKEQVSFKTYQQAEQYVVKSLEKEPEIFSQDLRVGSEGDEVTLLQTSLKTLNYYRNDLSKNFDETLKESLIQFQIDGDIIEDANGFGAGYFGPQTRKALQIALQNHQAKKSDASPVSNIQDEEVRKLQQVLKDRGYEIEVTGIYDVKTTNAILKFEKDNSLVGTQIRDASGNFDSKALYALVVKLDKAVVNISESESIYSVSDDGFFKQDLKLGAKGEDVRRLQEELQKMNLFAVEISGYYGPLTEHAVFKLQQNFQLVGDKNSLGAGQLGIMTRGHLNKLIGQRQQTEKIIADRKDDHKANQIALR